MSVVPFPLTNEHPTSSHVTRRVPSLDRESLAETLADMADWARLGGRADEADQLLLAAWAVYDDRRQTQRVEIRRRALVSIDGKTMHAVCVNLSLAGALLTCDEPLPDSGTIVLKINQLPELTAAIIDGGLSPRVCFINLSADAAEALEAFLGQLMGSLHQVREAFKLSDAGGKALG